MWLSFLDSFLHKLLLCIVRGTCFVCLFLKTVFWAIVYIPYNSHPGRKSFFHGRNLIDSKQSPHFFIHLFLHISHIMNLFPTLLLGYYISCAIIIIMPSYFIHFWNTSFHVILDCWVFWSYFYSYTLVWILIDERALQFTRRQ